MDSQVLERKFEQMGAKIEAFKDLATRERIERMRRIAQNPRAFVRNRGAGTPPRLDVVKRGKDEVFVVDTFDQNIDVQVIDVRPDDRHLLLMFKRLDGKREVSKFLCGHDERHWFVAAVPESAGAKNVKDAMEALKPDLVKISLKRAGVKTKHHNKRHNKGFVRQGEWFFIPAPDLQIDERFIHKNEPISRGRGAKPHRCQELYRTGGEQVWVNHQHAPNGFTETQYKAFIIAHPEEGPRRGAWTVMMRGATAFVRGWVRHPDHSTIHLDGWHRVEMNLENKAKAMEFVAFLD
jgi:hypothetical protein